MEIPFDLLLMVASFHTKPRMKLLDWIPKDKLNWNILSENPNAIDLLEAHPDKIGWYNFIFNPDFIQVMRIFEKHSNVSKWDKELGEGNLSLKSSFSNKYFNDYNSSFPKRWYHLSKIPDAINILEKHNNLFSITAWKGISKNPSAIHILENKRAKIYWDGLYENPNPEIIRILEKKNPKKINWDILSINPSAIAFLEKHLDKVNWDKLSSNPSAIHLLEKHPEKINWNWLSSNPCAIHILEKYPENINWSYLSSNPKAIHVLEKNPERINWTALARNTNAIHILKKHPDNIYWTLLSKNPSIFEIDNEQYSKNIVAKSKKIDVYLS